MFGFGQDGPYAAKPAYDDLIQGATGLPALMAQTSDGMPRYVPNALVDRIVGLTAVGAVCASLVHRERTGRGQRVDIPMFETMAGFVMGDHMGGLTYEPPLDKGGYARHLSRDRRPYKTSDGYLSVIVYNDKQWESFFKATGRDDLRRDPKFATFAGRAVNIDIVYGELARIFETRSTAEWTELLTKADIPVMPMHDLESMLADPHLVATDYFPVVEHPTEGPIRSMKVSAKWSETAAETTRLAPRLNQHGEEILREAGFSADEIAAMVRDGVTKGQHRISSMDFALTANQESIRDARRENLRALRRRLLAEEGQGGRLSRRLPQGAGRCRLARHLHSRGVWRLRPRHHRCRDHDARPSRNPAPACPARPRST